MFCCCTVSSLWSGITRCLLTLQMYILYRLECPYRDSVRKSWTTKYKSCINQKVSLETALWTCICCIFRFIYDSRISNSRYINFKIFSCIRLQLCCWSIKFLPSEMLLSTVGITFCKRKIAFWKISGQTNNSEPLLFLRPFCWVKNGLFEATARLALPGPVQIMMAENLFVCCPG